VDEERLFVEVRKHARELFGAVLPLVWIHYDFGPWNLYRSEQDFTVIDWEFGLRVEKERFGLGLYDLLYFVIYWIHTVKHLKSEAAELRAFHKLFTKPDSSDKHSKAVHQVIQEYLDAFDIDQRFLPLMLVYLWIEQALHQFARKQVLAQVQTDTRVGNRCIQYIRIIAEHADQFFTRAPES
jgi:hypothetical protein